MRWTVLAIVMSGLVMSCAEAPTQPAATSGGSAELSRDLGTGATIVKFGQTGVDLSLPTGTCMFRPDGAGNYNNFLRTNTDGSVFLKLQDESGTITVIPTGGRAWVGTGRANVIWPNYRGDANTADWFEMTIVGSVSAGGQTAHATCEYRIANGNAVEWFVKLN